MFRQCAVTWGYGGITSEIGASFPNPNTKHDDSGPFLGISGSLDSIGGDNNLQVIIASYKPKVKCAEKITAPWLSVVSVFSQMEASKVQYKFGPEDTPGVEIGLPFYVTAGKWLPFHCCSFTVTGTDSIRRKSRQKKHDYCGQRRSNCNSLLVRDLGSSQLDCLHVYEDS